MSRLLNNTRLAVDISRKSCAKYHHHGAVIFRQGQVIATGWNDEKGHAEVNAVRNMWRVLRGSTYREKP